MSECCIREVKIEDIESILNLEIQYIHNQYSREMIIRNLSDSIYMHLLVEMDDKVVGYISITQVFEEANIIKIIVDKDFRKMGIGTKLLERSLQLLNDGIEKVFLEVRMDNVPAKKLYEKVGFKKEHERKNYYSDGMTAEIYWYYK